MTEPPINLPPQKSWFDPSKIVSFDPWGHLVPSAYGEDIKGGLDIRPSIAVTKGMSSTHTFVSYFVLTHDIIQLP